MRHDGAADQGYVALAWPTTDGRDLRSTLTRELLAAVIQIRVLEKLREELAATYSPESGSQAALSSDGFGFVLTATQAAPDKVDLVTASIREIAAELRDAPISDDLLLRARRPILERYREQERQNASWTNAVAMAQSRPDRLDRRRNRTDVLQAVTVADLQAAAREFLAADPLVIKVLPKP